ncbi:MAG: hypothetical protein H6624_07335 [Bdellovibrionaceae bacterium]|nr:hypothetical protein [Bdellovibrionales bacterium]MCB9084141.1 hypothetical protein [Pseudobdellovibrionaceae bacterium]
MAREWEFYWIRLSLYLGLPALALAWALSAPAQTDLPKVVGMDYLPQKSLRSEGAEDLSKIGNFQDYPQHRVTKWAPTGAQTVPIARDCHPRQFEEEYLALRGSENQKLELLRNYFDRCGGHLSRDADSGLKALLKMDKVQYRIFENPQIQPIRLTFSNGEASTGFLGLKADGRSRPFVVIRCGLACEAGNTPLVRALVSHLFDESPFHIMVLASHSSATNARENQRWVHGGHYEGQEMLEVGKWIRFVSPFRHLVGSLHMVGVGLGGHGALYTALYNDYNPINDDIKVFHSVIAYCPAINLEQSMKDIIEGRSLMAAYFRQRIWRTAKEIYPDVPDLQDLIDPNLPPPTGARMMEIMGISSARFQSRLPEGLALFPFRDKPVTNPSDFWSLNQFINQSDGVLTPTLVWNAKDDSLIDFARNGQALVDKHPEAQKGRLMILNTEKGNHCAQSVVYGWQATATILRTFIQDHSHDFFIKRRRITYPLVVDQPQLSPNQQHMLQEWKAQQGEDYFEIKFTVFNSDHNCQRPGKSSASCYESKTKLVRFADLPVPIMIPQTETEAEILTRWANSRLEIHGASGRLIESNEPGEKLVYISDISEPL